MTSARLRPLAALLAAGALALALAGCGGDGDSGSDPAPAATAGTAATATAPAGPSLAASQEVVDLINGFVAELPDLDAVDRTDPAALEAAADSSGEAATAIVARVDGVEAHECVERLAREQAGLMSDISGLVEAALAGRAEDVTAITERIQGFDEPAFERAEERCKASVGYTSTVEG